MQISLIDVAVVAALLLVGWRGFRGGLTGSLAWVAVALVAPYAAGFLTPHLAVWIAADVPDVPGFLREPVAGALALAASVVLSGVVASIVFGRLRGMLQSLPSVFSVADRALGTFAALSVGLVALGAVTITISGLLSTQQRAQLASSVWGSRVVSQLAPLAPYAMAMRQACPDGVPSAMAASLPDGLGESLGIGPEGLEAARLILPALRNGSIPELQGVPAGSAEDAQQLLLALSSGSGTEGAPPGSIDAARAVLTALSEGRLPGEEPLGGLPNDTSEAARLVMSFLAGGPCAPALAMAR